MPEALPTESPPPTASVKLAMTPAPKTLSPTMNVERARLLMAELAVGGMPVVDEDGQPIGMLSRTDLLWLDESAPDFEEVFEEETDGRLGYELRLVPRDQLVVGDVMSRGACIVPEDADVATAARLMVQQHVHRLVVVGLHGHVTGILSSLDLLRWFGSGQNARLDL